MPHTCPAWSRGVPEKFFKKSFLDRFWLFRKCWEILFFSKIPRFTKDFLTRLMRKSLVKSKKFRTKSKKIQHLRIYLFKINFLHEKIIIVESGFFLCRSKISPGIQKSYLEHRDHSKDAQKKSVFFARFSRFWMIFDDRYVHQPFTVP